MEQPSLADDIAFTRSMAEEGATAPSLSGRFAVMWGILAMAAFLTHWAILRGYIPVDRSMVGFVWLAMGVLGGIGSGILSMTLRDKPGQSTAGNKAESAGWPVIAVTLFGVAFAIGIGVGVRGLPTILFDMIIPMSFGFYAVMSALSARLFGLPGHRWRVVLSVLLAILTAALAGLPEIHLIAAGGIAIIQIIPGLLAIRAEPSPIV
ncbi:MAG: hypothetical protein AAFS13_00310 [Pseudomonadota bacterium]